MNRLTDKAWNFGVKGHLMVIQEPANLNGLEKINAYINKTNRTIVAIPKDGIKGNVNQFIIDFEKTMAASQYQIELT